MGRTHKLGEVPQHLVAGKDINKVHKLCLAPQHDSPQQAEGHLARDVQSQTGGGVVWSGFAWAGCHKGAWR